MGKIRGNTLESIQTYNIIWTASMEYSFVITGIHREVEMWTLRSASSKFPDRLSLCYCFSFYNAGRKILKMRIAAQYVISVINDNVVTVTTVASCHFNNRPVTNRDDFFT